MSEKHRVIIIPGLGDDVNKMSWVIPLWRRHGLEPMIHSIGWHDGKKFRPKLQILVERIDQFSKDGERISLIGCSAGASAALNAFIQRRDIVHKVITVCGRLKSGNQQGFRSFAARTVTSPSFAQSIQLFESREDVLSDKDRKKIMTVRALFGDELVPADTAIVCGAYNAVIPTLEHTFSIAMAVTLFSRPLIAFLKKEDK